MLSKCQQLCSMLGIIQNHCPSAMAILAILLVIVWPCQDNQALDWLCIISLVQKLVRAFTTKRFKSFFFHWWIAIIYCTKKLSRQFVLWNMRIQCFQRSKQILIYLSFRWWSWFKITGFRADRWFIGILIICSITINESHWRVFSNRI